MGLTGNHSRMLCFHSVAADESHQKHDMGALTMNGYIVVHGAADSGSVEVKASLPYFLTEEEGGVTAFTPLLDFSTCGKNRQDAQKMFEEGVRIFVSELIRMGTLERVLREYGWRKTSRPNQPDRWVHSKLICREQKVRTAVAMSG